MKSDFSNIGENWLAKMESREKSPSCREKQPRATESAKLRAFLGPRRGSERTKGPKNQAGPRGLAPELGSTVGRAQRKSSAPTAAHLCGLDGGPAHQPGVAGPRCEAGGGGRTDAPPSATSTGTAGRLGRWEKTGKASSPQGRGDRVGRKPLLPPCPGGRVEGLGEGDRGPGVVGSCRDTSRAGGWGGGGKAEENPRHTGLNS